MAQYFEIPLTPSPQRFTLPLNGVTYGINLYWNGAVNLWMIDIQSEDETPLLSGIPLVTGTDLLGQFKHLGIGGSLLVQVDGNPYGVPSYENLGTESRLIFVVEDA